MTTLTQAALKTTPKAVVAVHDAPSPHWVGNGFPVRSLFSYHKHADIVSPFLLLDYAGPHPFEPGFGTRGVGEHPHKGFETVTIVYEGEVEHRDSTGAGGVIGPGDVQWMTAGGGILHEEFHSKAFVARGGPLEIVQMWVNLPAKDKPRAPSYQNLTAASIPVVDLPDSMGRMRIIAGEYAGGGSAPCRGPAHTHTPMNVWDLRLSAGGQTTLAIPSGHTQILVVLHGTVRINDQTQAERAQWVQFEREGGGIELEAQTDCVLLLLTGEPIHEPVAGYGPFVMNTQAEIIQTIADFRSGRFGQLGDNRAGSNRVREMAHAV